MIGLLKPTHHLAGASVGDDMSEDAKGHYTVAVATSLLALGVLFSVLAPNVARIPPQTDQRGCAAEDTRPPEPQQGSDTSVEQLANG
ncbi:MAG: hypothetical protein AB8G99_10655, partial [Planctomycetaceae bacterium]